MFEAPESITDLALRFQLEDEAERRSIAFARFADKKRRTTGRFPGGDFAEYWQPFASAEAAS
jgi:hypothetical protein